MRPKNSVAITVITKGMVWFRLYWAARGFRQSTLSLFPRITIGVGHTPSSARTTVAMARALEQVVRRDRVWFQVHPERWHLCRWPDRSELDFYDSDLDAHLIIAICHLGRGRIVYQPVIFEGTLPADERSAAALFALAARNPEPIPVVTEMVLLRLRRGGALSQRITAAAASSSSSSSGVALPHTH